MKQHSKRAIQEAERLGYEYARTNSSNFLVYEHPTAGEVCLSQSMSENACRTAIRQMQKAVGALVRTSGRSASVVKGRRARRAELETERAAAELRRIEAHHEAFLARVGSAPLAQGDRDELRQIEARLAELRALAGLMTDVPSTSAHRGAGQARHQAGGRS